MASQNLNCERYMSCTTGSRLKYYTILALILLLADVLTARPGGEPAAFEAKKCGLCMI